MARLHSRWSGANKLQFYQGDNTILEIDGDSAKVTAAAAEISGNVAISDTIATATVATRRLVHGALTITPESTISVLDGGSLAGVRGEITVSASKTFVDGFLYGAQGKVTLHGTLNEQAAGRIAGAIGQVDLSTGTVTAGQVSAVWGDLQGNPTLTVNDQVYVGRFTNSMTAGKKAQAFLLMYGEADYLIEVAKDDGGGDWVAAAAVGGEQTHKLKVRVNGTDFFIPLHTA